MRKQRAVSVAFAVVFLTVFATSTALADVVHSEFANLNGIEHRALNLPEIGRTEDEAYLFAGIQSNNGKHLGFGVASIHRGPLLGIVRPTAPTVTQNPEPATMVLLGTGLAAVGAAIRRRRKV